jgi:hypothetical protein
MPLVRIRVLPWPRALPLSFLEPLLVSKDVVGTRLQAIFARTEQQSTTNSLFHARRVFHDDMFELTASVGARAHLRGS